MPYIKRVTLEYTDGDFVHLDFASRQDVGCVDFEYVDASAVWGGTSMTLFAALLTLIAEDNLID